VIFKAFLLNLFMNIPSLYSTILEKDKLLKGVVYTTTEIFGQILQENKLYFFEEYTDHGIRHIESVLQSSLELIPSDSRGDFLDAENVCALILAVLLHDLGMHQSPKSFTHLISKKNIIFPQLDSISWSELWNGYIEEAKKFNSQQRKEIYGDYDYIISIPCLNDFDEIDGYQRKLIGEFIRRHHARLAHEIAVCGFETGEDVIKFADNYDPEKLNIVGLIARSHGMDIRSTYPFMQNLFSRSNKKPYGIHVYYLMILLRISDYFQIDSNRLLPISLKLKSFKSPISETEHNKHLSIKELSEVDEDPETLFIRALPKSNFIFNKLLELIKEIQNEIDISWAIIGEKYGKDKIKPAIKFRRIISNLNDDYFQQSLNYIPDKILFDSHPDLAKLLVAPLYGNNPTYGVRELIQNSLDAINERVSLENLGDEFDSIIAINIVHDNEEEYYFEIKDNGKGMSVKEVKNYFLKAGSTNRKSKEWDDNYLDENRNSKVLKSGKFGVGVLAAFLIGDELEVKTRRVDSNTGLYFKANINSRDIEITKLEGLSFGTSIKIKIRAEAIELFKNPSDQLIAWDKWYTLKKPKITYNCILEYNKKYGYNEYDPSYLKNEANWVEFSSAGYSKLRWSYVQKVLPFGGKYQLTYNGLVVPLPPLLYSGSIMPPHIQVFDFNGIFPINLNRNTLDSNKLPFEKELIRSVFTQILTLLLEIEPELIVENNGIDIRNRIKFPKLFGRININDFFDGFFYTNRGYCLKNGFMNDYIRNTKYLIINLKKRDAISSLQLKLNDDFLIEFSRFEHETITGYTSTSSFKKTIEWALYLGKNTKDYAFESDPDYKKEIIEIKTVPFTVFKKHHIKSLPIFLGNISEFDLGHVQSIICYSGISVNRIDLNREFNQFLKEVFSTDYSPFIPYNVEDRKVKIEQILKSIR
jgi:molecular chaperone HtpG